MTFWESLILTFVATCLGGIIAAWVGYSTQRKIEQRKEKEQRHSHLEQLRTYLKAFRTEIETNILFLKSLRNKDARKAVSMAAVCTSTRDTCLANLGSIPLPQTNRVIENLTGTYNCFDKVNQIWEALQHKIIAGGRASTQPQVLENDVFDSTLEEAKLALERIREVEEEIDSLLDT